MRDAASFLFAVAIEVLTRAFLLVALVSLVVVVWLTLEVRQTRKELDERWATSQSNVEWLMTVEAERADPR